MSAVEGCPLRDAHEVDPNRRWDFGDYKFHPLWGEKPSKEDVQAITVGGEPLFRGTSSKFLMPTKLLPHPESNKTAQDFLRGRMLSGPVPRIYMSESPEDALGYGCIEAEEGKGGIPLICAIKIDREIFKSLKPGYEGKGEWYVERDSIPRKDIRCRRITKKECEQGYPDGKIFED